jgi:putative FmdB family regulatory protein
MPLFDYECKNCGKELIDVLQGINEGPLVYCPECNEPELSRRLGVSNFILKGEGWYSPTKTENDK